MEFLNYPEILVAVGIISLPVYAVLAKIFWGDRFESLGETIKYLIWPDLYSLFKGRFWDDWFATTKFNLYLFLCLGWAAAWTDIIAKLFL